MVTALLKAGSDSVAFLTVSPKGTYTDFKYDLASVTAVFRSIKRPKKGKRSVNIRQGGKWLKYALSTHNLEMARALLANVQSLSPTSYRNQLITDLHSGRGEEKCVIQLADECSLRGTRITTADLLRLGQYLPVDDPREMLLSLLEKGGADNFYRRFHTSPVRQRWDHTPYTMCTPAEEKDGLGESLLDFARSHKGDHTYGYVGLHLRYLLFEYADRVNKLAYTDVTRRAVVELRWAAAGSDSLSLIDLLCCFVAFLLCSRFSPFSHLSHLSRPLLR
jgi:hypothetical protein